MPHFLLNSNSRSTPPADAALARSTSEISLFRKKPLRCTLAYTLSLLFIWQPLLVAAQPLTATHQTSGRPTIDEAANGVPIVNIQTPNSGGVSQNFYNDFNVGDSGLILNNSRQLTQTQLGGQIEGNPNLTGGSARLILNEVISNNPSALNGYIEVGGVRADVVVANPNGISCNGCGFINTNHATLTTGQPIMDGSSLSGFNVQQGAVSILEEGLNAANTTRFDVIARSVEVAGALHADTLNIVTGQQTVERNSLNTTNITSDANKPSFAIDSTALGGMYANRIRLIANEEGVGVRLNAPVSAQNGDLQLSANGNIQYTDLAATRDISITANQYGVEGTGTVLAEGDFTLQADSYENSGDVIAEGRVDVTTTTSITNSGTLAGREKLTLQTDTLANNPGGALLSEGNIDIAADHVTNTLADIYALGSINIEGTESGTAATQVENRSGRIQAEGDLNIGATALNNMRDFLDWEEKLVEGNLYYYCTDCSGDHLIVVYTFTEHFFRALDAATTGRSVISADGNMTLRGDTLVNNTSDILALGNMTLDFNEIQNLGLHSGEYTKKSRYGPHYLYGPLHESYVYSDIAPYNRRNYHGGAWYASDGANKDLEYMGLRPNSVNSNYDPDNLLRREDNIIHRNVGLSSTDIVALESTNILGANILAGGNLVFGGAADSAAIINADLGHVEAELYDPDAIIALGAGSQGGSIDNYLTGVNGGLFSIADPGHPYLIETNPFFASTGGFLGSEYLLNRLGWDPDGALRLLGDGFYEQQLIRQQIVDLTGRASLSKKHVDANKQYRILLDNGLYAAESLELAIGVSLTAEQINQLTSDIVWMIEKEVAGEVVLVPQLYLSPQSIVIDNSSGALIAAGNNLINNGGSVYNTGTMHAGNDMRLNLDENGLRNIGGTIIAENTLRIDSEGDVENISGTLQGKKIDIGALGDIINQRWSSQREFAHGGIHEWQTHTGAAAEINGANKVRLHADGDINVEGSRISGGKVSLDADGNINIGTVAVRNGREGAYYGGTLSESSVRHLSSDIISTLNLLANAGNDLNITGSHLSSDRAIALNAGNDLTIQSAANSDSYNFLSRHDGETSHTIERSVRHQGSTINAQGNVSLQSDNNLTVIASKLEAGKDLSLLAVGDVQLLAERDSDYRYSYEEDDGDFGKSKTLTTEQDSQRLVGSSLRAGGALSLKTESGDIKLIASTGHGEESVHVDSGRGVYIESGVNSDYTRTQETNKNAARVKTRDQGSLTQTLVQAGLSSEGDLSIDAEGDVVLAAAQLESKGNIRIGDASFALDEHGALKLDEEGNPIVDRGSIDNLYIGTVALEDENWDVKTRSLRGPVKGLAKAFTAFMAMVGMYMPVVAVAVADAEPELVLAESSESRTQERLEAGSSMQAANIQLSAQGDMTLTGSSLTADEESGKVVMLADNILLDTAITQTTQTERNQIESASGIQASLKEDEISLGGLRLTDREQSTITTAVTHQGSSIKGNQIVLDAQGNLKLINANIEATGEDGVLSLAGDTVEITGVQDEFVITETLTEKITETSVGIRNAYVDVGFAIKNLADAVSAVDDARDALSDAEERVEQGTLAKEALKDYRIMLGAATANLVQAELASTAALAATAAGAAALGTGFYASGSAQRSETRSTSTNAEKTWKGSTLSAAYMTVDADKASIIGSSLSAGRLDLNATDILIGAGKNEQSSSSTQDSKNGGFSASTSGAGSWNANVGFNEAESQSDATQYVNSQINVGHLNSSSNKLTIKGGVVAANTADIKTDTLHIESLQDTHSSSNSSSGANIGVGGGTNTKGVPQGGSAGFNNSKGSGEGARVNEQSAILIADGEASTVSAKDTALIGGMIANASREIDAETGEVSLVDHGNLTFSTETLTVEDLRDYSKSDQQGYGVQWSQATTTISAQDTGHEMEGETRATIGGGNVTVGGQNLDDHDDFADLNRNVNEAQVVTLDQQTGALDTSVTVDNRLVSSKGLADIAKQHKNLKNNAKITAGIAVTDLARMGVVVAGVIEASQIGNALNKIGGSQKAAYDNDGKLAGDIEGIRDGGVEDAQYAQNALNDADKVINGGDGERIKVTGDLYSPDGQTVAGASNETTNSMYLSLGENNRGDIVTTMAHEGMHLDGAGESMAGLTGWFAGLTYSANAWGNSDQIAQHQAVVPVMNSFRQEQLLQQNVASFDRDASRDQLQFRQLDSPEIKAIRDYAPRMAKQEGTSIAEAEKRMGQLLRELTDETKSQQMQLSGEPLDPVALAHLSEALVKIGSRYRPQSESDVPVLPEFEVDVIDTADSVRTNLLMFSDNFPHQFTDRTMFGEQLLVSENDSETRRFYEEHFRPDLGVGDTLYSVSASTAGGAMGAFDVADGIVGGLAFLLKNRPSTSAKAIFEGTQATSSDIQSFLYDPFDYRNEYNKSTQDANINAYLDRLEGLDFEVSRKATAANLGVALAVAEFLPVARFASLRALDKVDGGYGLYDNSGSKGSFLLDSPALIQLESAALQRIAANNQLAGNGASISPVGRGVGANQLTDRIAGEIQGAVNQADRVLSAGGSGGTQWGSIYQRFNGTGHWLEPLARGNAIQQIAERRLLNNIYLQEAKVIFNRGHVLGLRNAAGNLLRPDFQAPLANGKVGVFDITTNQQAPKIFKYSPKESPQLTPQLINITYGSQ